MNFNLITYIESCYLAVQENPQMLFYSHIPTAVISLLVVFFIFSRNKKSIPSIALLLVSISFSIWSYLDLITWTSYDSRLIMFAWALMNLIEPLIFLFCLIFTYSFIVKDNIPKKLMVAIIVIIAPLFYYIPSKLNLAKFNISDCEAKQGKLIYYVYFLIIFFSFSILYVLIRGFFRAEKEFRKQIVLLGLGVSVFLISFSFANILGNFTTNWAATQYGLFGMPIFMGFLAYLIVKYRVFNIKLIATQALIVALVILIASQFAFIRNNINKILTAITLLIAIIFGWILVRSVKKEVRQKEELEMANREINERKDQLQKMADSLAVANDKLKVLDSAKTEFISMASHQLRTPVAGIKGYLSMLLEGSYGAVNSEQKSALQKTFDSNERMVNLIEDLLNVSRIESGRLEYEFSNVKIEDLCREVVDTLYPKAKNLGLYLDYKKSNIDLLELWIDGGKVKEVISNLLDNAIKYTPRGGVSLTVNLCNKNELNCLSERHIRITVSDTGIGVPKEEMPYLFEKFSRGKDINRLNTGGTGLGLFVGRKMIEGNGGKVWVESEGKDKGSRFIIELPMRKNDD